MSMTEFEQSMLNSINNISLELKSIREWLTPPYCYLSVKNEDNKRIVEFDEESVRQRLESMHKVNSIIYEYIKRDS